MQIGKIKNINIDEQLFDDIQEATSSEFVESFLKFEERFRSELNTAMTKAIKQHPVFKGITGQYAGTTDGSDLQAEFGLTDEMASSAANKITDELKKHISIDMNTERIGKNYKLQIALNLDDEYKEKLSGDPFEYTSLTPGSNAPHIVKWMEFLLNAANGAIDEYIEDIFEYGITYDFAGKNSRSGRATMTKDQDLAVDNRSFPYLINKRFVSFDGDDFIEDSFQSREFGTISRDIIDKLINNVLDDINKGR